MLRGDRAARLASLALVAAGTLALLGWLGVAHTLRAHAAPAAVALIVALALGIAAARAFQRWPLILPFAACIALPFRFPVHLGGQDANLLVPLYAVIGVAWIALVLDALRSAEPARVPLRRLALPLLLLVAWESASLAWSASATEGAKAIAFYALPFGVLLAALVAHPPPRPRLPSLLRVQVALALVFAAIGVYQVLRHDVWWNRKLMVSNAFSSFFRANSVFYDPSIYGRYLAVTITLVFAALMFGVVRQPLRAAIAARARVGRHPHVVLPVGLSRALRRGRRRPHPGLRPPPCVGPAAGGARRGPGARRGALGAPLGRRPRDVRALPARRRRPAPLPRAPASRAWGWAARPTPRASRPLRAARCATRST